MAFLVFIGKTKKTNDVLLQYNLKTILSAIFKVVDKYFVSNKDFAELAKHIEKLGNLREL